MWSMATGRYDPEGVAPAVRALAAPQAVQQQCVRTSAGRLRRCTPRAGRHQHYPLPDLVHGLLNGGRKQISTSITFAECIPESLRRQRLSIANI